MSNLQKLILILVFLILVGLGAAGYFFYQYQETQKELQNLKTDPSSINKAAEADVKKLIDEISQLIILPSDEVPTIATVTDIEKLRNQEFFTNAKNGDKVLIYTSNKKAILYDPIAKKIVDVAPINIGSSSASPSAGLKTEEKVKLALRNGTSSVGLTTKIETDLKKNNTNVEVISKENAEKRDYDRTIVVTLKDTAKDAASKMAKELKANVEAVPAGEITPQDADILIIVGKDKT